MSLQQQAQDRKQRLSQLRKSRNYDPSANLPKSGLTDSNHLQENTVERESDRVHQEALEQLKQTTNPDTNDNNNSSTTTTPEKYDQDWDLKRSLQPQLDELDKQTNNAILKIVRKRIQQEYKNNNNE